MTNRDSRRIKTMLMAACAALAIVPATGHAQQRVSYSIPAQDLGTALTELARQSNREIFFRADLTRGKRARRLSGKMSFELALERLLDGSGLGYRINASGSIVIETARQAGNDTTADERDIGDDERGKAEILVVGSRSQNIDIRRTEDDPQPYVVFDAKDIQSSQATTLEDFFKNRLPMNTIGTTNSQFTGNGTPLSSIDLRGLGTAQTLILVDGRRMASIGNQTAAPKQADINGIPLASIDRIEVLPSSAGGIYGGNAVGGVVNIVLKRDYQGVELRATYQDTFDFHAPRGRFEVTGGFSLEGGRTRVTFGGSYSKAGTLLAGDRDLTDRGIALYRQNVDIFSLAQPPRAAGINIRSTSGNLILKDGTNLGSPVTYIPFGYSGDVTTVLKANAGKYDLSAPLGLNGANRSLTTSPEQRSFSATIRREFISWLDIFVDYSRLENRGHSYSANQMPGDTTVSSTNPTNVFKGNVRVTYDTPTLIFPYDHKSRVDRLTAGFIARIGGGWAANFDYTRNWASFSQVFSNTTVDGASSCALAGLLPNSATCQSAVGSSPTDTRQLINLFKPPLDAQFEPYLLTPPTAASGPNRSVLSTPSLRLSGPLFKLAGGNATLTLAATRDSTVYESSYFKTIDNAAPTNYYFSYYPGRFQRSTAEYAELTLPLVAPSNNIPLIYQLELTGSIRADQYKTVSPPAAFNIVSTHGTEPGPVPAFDNVEARLGSRNFTLAGRWAFNSSIAVRASYATGFLPPNVVQIADRITTGLSTFTDPRRGNESVLRTITARSGSGSPDLRPELSKTLSVGVILTPSFLDGFRLSADYTRIAKKGEIYGLNINTLLAYEQYFPGRITRGDKLPGDPASYAGVVTGYDATPINISRRLVQSVDFQVDYRFGNARIGEFRAYVIGTWQPEFTTQLLPPLPALNSAGYGNGPLEWRANGGIDWSRGPLSIQWNAQFFDGYFVYDRVDQSTTVGLGLVTTAITTQGADRIPSQMYHDLSISYAFDKKRGVFNDLTISAGVQNLFNKYPPVIAVSGYGAGGYSGYGDPRLRRFTLSLRKGF